MTLRELGCAVKGFEEDRKRGEQSALTRTRLLGYFIVKSGFMKWDGIKQPSDLFPIEGEEELKRAYAESIPLAQMEPADNNW